jgi:hypothetical protein
MFLRYVLLIMHVCIAFMLAPGLRYKPILP